MTKGKPMPAHMKADFMKTRYIPPHVKHDEYIAFLSNALVKHPGLSDIECNPYAQVLLRPGHEVQLGDMASTRLRELFFDYYIADHAIPALRAHLLII